MDGVKVTQVRKAKEKEMSAQYIVELHGRLVGVLEKYRNTRTETHPWKAFGPPKTVPEPNDFYGAFFGANGKARALETVLGQA